VTVELRRIECGSPEHKGAIAQLEEREAQPMSGRAVALAALRGSPTAQMVVAYQDDDVVGAASWRVTEDGVKRINTGVLYRQQGIGTALVKFIARQHLGLPMWTKSHPQSWGFCEALGMTPDEVLETGHRIYRWTAEEVEEFCS
jgi:hypothetical protein